MKKLDIVKFPWLLHVAGIIVWLIIVIVINTLTGLRGLGLIPLIVVLIAAHSIYLQSTKEDKKGYLAYFLTIIGIAIILKLLSFLW